jgi:enediyne biosynthesis protein E4
VTESLDAHTIPMWSDYDQDGDMDIFIGSGEISRLTPDNLFRNTLVENGTPGFDRITTAPIATDPVNGQNWNWIDYDNDGDFDAYQTNYSLTTNNLYRNDGGTYVAMTEGDVGPIVSNADLGLGNVWGDFDNDGDLDCLVTNDGSGRIDHFRNDGGTFAQVTGTAITTQPGPHYGSPIADYDRDGDLDVYVHGTATTKALWENQLANGYSWINVKLVGAGAPLSNVSAIGARVRAKATVFGTPTWQLREVTAENGFNSMNSLNVHFGFGDATVIDSLVIAWPAGGVDVMTSVPVEQFLTVNEAMAPTAVNGPLAAAAAGSLGPARPNPFTSSTEIAFELARASHVTLDVIDVAGRRVRTLLDESGAPGVHRAVWDGRDADGRAVASGVYLMRMTTAPDGDGPREVRTRRMIRMR